MVFYICVVAVGVGLILVVGSFAAPPSTFRRRSACVVAVSFALLAVLYFGQARWLQWQEGPEYHTLPAGSLGEQGLEVPMVNGAPGYLLRLAWKDPTRRGVTVDHSPYQACRWKLVGAPELPHEHSSDCGCSPGDDWLYDFWHPGPPVDLRYQVTPQTKPLLEQVVLEVRCNRSYRNLIAMGGGFCDLLGVLLLIGSLLALWAYMVQIRRARRLRTPVPSTSYPPAP